MRMMIITASFITVITQHKLLLQPRILIRFEINNPNVEENFYGNFSMQSDSKIHRQGCRRGEAYYGTRFFVGNQDRNSIS